MSSRHSLAGDFGATLLLMIACAGAVAQITPQQAVQDARSVAVPDPRTVVTPANAAATVPQYGADVSPQSGLFQGGTGQLQTPGVTRVAACMAANDPECIAVQLVATGRATRPLFTINPADPLITGAVNVASNPTAIVGINPAGATPGFQTCTTTTQTTPPTYVDESCDIAVPDTENPCRVTRDIQVDADAVYRCETSPNQRTVYNCNKTLQVDVQVTTAASCSGDFTIAPLIPGGNTPGLSGCDFDFQPIQVVCNTADSNITFRQYYQFLNGGNGYWNASVDPASTSSTWLPLCSGMAPIRMTPVSQCDANGNNCSYKFDVMRQCGIWGDGDNGQYWMCGNAYCGLFPGDPACPTETVQFGADWWAVEATATSGLFAKPGTSTSYSIVDTWINGCAALEARQ